MPINLFLLINLYAFFQMEGKIAANFSATWRRSMSACGVVFDSYS